MLYTYVAQHPGDQDCGLLLSLAIIIAYLCKGPLSHHVYLTTIGRFNITSSPPCWWTVNKRSLISSLCPPAFVHFTIVICVSRDCMKTIYDDLVDHNSIQPDSLVNVLLLPDINIYRMSRGCTAPVISSCYSFLCCIFLASCMGEFLFFHSVQVEDVSLVVWLADFHGHSPLI